MAMYEILDIAPCSAWNTEQDKERLIGKYILIDAKNSFCMQLSDAPEGYVAFMTGNLLIDKEVWCFGGVDHISIYGVKLRKCNMTKQY